MIRSHPISSITLLPQYEIWSNLVLTKSYGEGESNGVSYEVFGGELTEDVGFYRRINKSALIRIINAFYFWLCFHLVASPSIHQRFFFNFGPFPVGLGALLR